MNELGFSQFLLFCEKYCRKTESVRAVAAGPVRSIRQIKGSLRRPLTLCLQISPMVKAMREGVSNVIEPTWLGMFDPAELQVIVSGTDAEIDIEDMKKNTVVYPCEGKALPFFLQIIIY